MRLCVSRRAKIRMTRVSAGDCALAIWRPLLPQSGSILRTAIQDRMARSLLRDSSSTAAKRGRFTRSPTGFGGVGQRTRQVPRSARNSSAPSGSKSGNARILARTKFGTCSYGGRCPQSMNPMAPRCIQGNICKESTHVHHPGEPPNPANNNGAVFESTRI